MEEILKEKYPNPSRYQRNNLIKKIFNKYPFLKKKYFLDICGAGQVLVFMDEFGMSGEGIDLSEDACSIARGRVSENIKVNRGNFMEIENKRYEIVLMLDVLEHIKEDDLFIKKTYDLLNDGEYYLINVPAKMEIFAKADVAVGHYRRYEKYDLRILLEENGFEIIEFWSYGFPIFGKIYSYLMRQEVVDDKEANTIKSGTSHPKFMKYLYPIIGKFYWILRFQNLILNTNVGSQYLVLCKKND